MTINIPWHAHVGKATKPPGPSSNSGVCPISCERKKRDLEAALTQPPITRVCRQLRIETLSLSYQLRSYRMWISLKVGCYYDIELDQPLSRWLAAIGETNRNSLRIVHLYPTGLCRGLQESLNRMARSGGFAISEELMQRIEFHGPK